MKRGDRAGWHNQWDDMRQYQIDFLLRKGLQPHHTYLDIGCGPLRGGIPVIDYLDAGHYTGVDAWVDSLKEARAELEEADLQDKEPTLIEMDVTDPLATVGQRFDCIMAFSVSHHLKHDGLDALAGFVFRHLAGGGIFYGTALIGEPPYILPNWFHYPVISRPFEDCRAAFERNGLSLCHEEVVPVLRNEHIMSAERNRQ